MGGAGVSDSSVGIYQSTRRHTSDDNTPPSYTSRPSVASGWADGQKHKESQEHDRKISSKHHHATKVFITARLLEYSTSVKRPLHFQFQTLN